MWPIKFSIGLWRKLFTKTKTNEDRVKMKDSEASYNIPLSKGINLQEMQKNIIEDISAVGVNHKIPTPKILLFSGDIANCDQSINNFHKLAAKYTDLESSRIQFSRNNPMASTTPAGQFPAIAMGSSIEDIMSGKSKEEIKTEVVKALENKNFDWRTIDGISRETHLPKEEVSEMINQLIKEGVVVRAPYLDKKGRRIYTTRKHYHETVGFIGRLISSMTNRII